VVFRRSSGFWKTNLIRRDIDRKKIAAIVFEDRAKLRRLNKIVHPAIIREIKKGIQKFKRNKNTIILIDAPLLIERVCTACATM